MLPKKGDNMKNFSKPLLYGFSGVIILMNTIFLSLELHRLFKMNAYIERFGTSSSISERTYLEMQQVNDMREMIGFVTTIIGIGLILFFSFKYKGSSPHLFYVYSGINSLFLIGMFIISSLGSFHIIELIGALSLPILMNGLMGLNDLRNLTRVKKNEHVKI